LWDYPPDGSGDYMTRNRQHELVQGLTLAYLQRVFGQDESFAQWLADPGLPGEVVLESRM